MKELARWGSQPAFSVTFIPFAGHRCAVIGVVLSGAHFGGMVCSYLR